jgi:hypothetical protein
MLHGTAFVPGMTVRIDGAGRSETAKVDVIDGEHATVRRCPGRMCRLLRS